MPTDYDKYRKEIEAIAGTRPSAPEPVIPPAPVVPEQPVAKVGLERNIPKDVMTSLVKGGIGTAQAAVGLVDLIPGIKLGKSLDKAGFSFADMQQRMSQDYSPAQQAALKHWEDAKGIREATGSLLSNPSVAMHAAVESLLPSVAGGLIGRGVMTAAPHVLGKMAPAITRGMAAAFGEGAVTAGALNEGIRSETPEKETSLGQKGMAIGGGIITSLISGAGARFGAKRGLANIDELGMAPEKELNKTLVKIGSKIKNPGVVKRIVEGGGVEFFEELTQEGQEQVWQNAALGKPLLEDVPKSMLLGGAAGGLTGAVYNIRPDEVKTHVPTPTKGDRDAFIAAAVSQDMPSDSINKLKTVPQLRDQWGLSEADVDYIEQLQQHPTIQQAYATINSAPTESAKQGMQAYLFNWVKQQQGDLGIEKPAVEVQPTETEELKSIGHKAKPAEKLSVKALEKRLEKLEKKREELTELQKLDPENADALGQLKTVDRLKRVTETTLAKKTKEKKHADIDIMTQDLASLTFERQKLESAESLTKEETKRLSAVHKEIDERMEQIRQLARDSSEESRAKERKSKVLASVPINDAIEGDKTAARAGVMYTDMSDEELDKNITENADKVATLDAMAILSADDRKELKDAKTLLKEFTHTKKQRAADAAAAKAAALAKEKEQEKSTIGKATPEVRSKLKTLGYSDKDVDNMPAETAQNAAALNILVKKLESSAEGTRPMATPKRDKKGRSYSEKPLPEQSARIFEAIKAGTVVKDWNEKQSVSFGNETLKVTPAHIKALKARGLVDTEQDTKNLIPLDPNTRTTDIAKNELVKVASEIGPIKHEAVEGFHRSTDPERLEKGIEPSDDTFRIVRDPASLTTAQAQADEMAAKFKTGAPAIKETSGQQQDYNVTFEGTIVDYNNPKTKRFIDKLLVNLANEGSGLPVEHAVYEQLRKYGIDAVDNFNGIRGGTELHILNTKGLKVGKPFVAPKVKKVTKAAKAPKVELSPEDQLKASIARTVGTIKAFQTNISLLEEDYADLPADKKVGPKGKEIQAKIENIKKAIAGLEAQNIQATNTLKLAGKTAPKKVEPKKAKPKKAKFKKAESKSLQVLQAELFSLKSIRAEYRKKLATGPENAKEIKAKVETLNEKINATLAAINRASTTPDVKTKKSKTAKAKAKAVAKPVMPTEPKKGIDTADIQARINKIKDQIAAAKAKFEDTDKLAHQLKLLKESLESKLAESKEAPPKKPATPKKPTPKEKDEALRKVNLANPTMSTAQQRAVKYLASGKTIKMAEGKKVHPSSETGLSTLKALEKKGIVKRAIDGTYSLADVFTSEGEIQAMYGGPKARGFKQAKEQGEVFRNMHDKKQRFHISDKDIKLSPLWNKYEVGAEVPLEELISHPLLFVNYPSLRNLMVKVKHLGPTKSASTVYNDSTKSLGITINSELSKLKFTTCLLHEIQHVIQETENFATGSSITLHKLVVDLPRVKEIAAFIKDPSLDEALKKFERDLPFIKNLLNKRKALMRKRLGEFKNEFDTKSDDELSKEAKTLSDEFDSVMRLLEREQDDHYLLTWLAYESSAGENEANATSADYVDQKVNEDLKKSPSKEAIIAAREFIEAKKLFTEATDDEDQDIAAGLSYDAMMAFSTVFENQYGIDPFELSEQSKQFASIVEVAKSIAKGIFQAKLPVKHTIYSLSKNRAIVSFEKVDDEVIAYHEVRQSVREMSSDDEYGYITALAAEQKIKEWTAKWRWTGNIHVIKDESQLPGEASSLLSTKGRKTRGFYMDVTGNIYIISDNNYTYKELFSNLMHEAIGHHGLRMIPEHIVNPFLDQIWKDKQNTDRMKFINEHYAHVAKAKTAEERLIAQRQAAEEWIAYKVAETALNEEENPTWLDQFITMIRSWLRSMGINFKVTDAEIKTWLSNMRQAVVRGDKRQWKKRGVSQAVSTENAAVWYSKMTNFLKSKIKGSTDAKQLKDTIKTWSDKGEFKAEELEWSGLLDWLSERSGKVSPQEVVDYLDANKVEIIETNKSGHLIISPEVKRAYRLLSDRGFEQEFSIEENETTLTVVVTPNGRSLDLYYKDYKDTSIFKSLAKDEQGAINTIVKEQEKTAPDSSTFTKFDGFQLQGERKDYTELLLRVPSREHKGMNFYYKNHWEEPNVLVHVRFNTRTGPSGEKILFLEEVQSDWHQAGREKGYASDKLSVPDAPFKPTSSWMMLAVKRMVRYAAENNFDTIAWTPGIEQIRRYETSFRQRVDTIEWYKNNAGDKIVAVSKDNKPVANFTLDADGNIKTSEIGESVSKHITAVVGKSIGNRIMLEDAAKVSGDDLSIGGEGMKSFYDQRMPNEINKFFGKKTWGNARVGTTTIKTGKKDTEVWSIPVTNEMKQKALDEGMPLFQLSEEESTWAALTKQPKTAQEAQAAQEADLKQINNIIATKFKDPAVKKIANLFGRIFKALPENIDQPVRDANTQTTNFFTRILSSPEFYFTRSSAAAKVMAHAINQTQLKFETLHGLTGESLNTIEQISQTDPESYDKGGEYLRSIDESGVGYGLQFKGKKWHVLTPKRNIIYSFESEKLAVAKMVEEEGKHVKSLGYSDNVVRMVKEWRQFTNRCFDTQVAEMRKQIKRSKDNDLPEPTVVFTNEKGQEREVIPMSVAIALMGDRRGTYFPRERPSRQYVLIADAGGPLGKKELIPISAYLPPNTLNGPVKTWLKQAINSALPVSKEVQKLKDKGFTDDQISIRLVNRPSESTFDAPGSVTAIDTILKLAEEKVLNDDNITQTEIDLLNAMSQRISLAVGDIYKQKGALKSRMARAAEHWEGYESDPLKAASAHAQRLAAGISRRTTTRGMLEAFTGRDVSFKEYQKEHPNAQYKEYRQYVRDKAVHPVKQRQLYDDLRTYMTHVSRPDTKVDRFVGYLKGLAVLKFLGLRASSAVINLTGLMTAGPATLSTHANISLLQATKFIAEAIPKYLSYRAHVMQKKGLLSSAMKAMFKPGKLTAEDIAIFDEITAKGLDEAQFNRETMRQLQSKAGDFWNSLMSFAMMFFGATERLNRAVTIHAAQRALKMKDPNLTQQSLLDKSIFISNRTHGIYGKEAKPWLVQKVPFLDLPYTFFKYQQTYLLNAWEQGVTFGNVKNAMFMLLAPAVLAGAGTSVFTPAASAVASVIMRSFRIKGADDPEEALYEWAEKTLGSDAFFRNGFAGLANINLKGSLQINAPLPDLSDGYVGLMGAPGAVFTDIIKGFVETEKYGWVKGMESFMPTAISSIMKGHREYTEGVSGKDYSPIFFGEGRLKGSAMDFAMRSIAFNPAHISGRREKQWRENQVRLNYQKDRSLVLDRLKKLLTQGPENATVEGYAELYKTIDEYNNRAAMADPKYYVPMITSKWLNTQIKRIASPNKYERLREI